MNNVPVHDDSAGFAAKLADATAEPWCNHDTAALDAEGVCECGSTLSQRMVAMLEDELGRDDSSAAEIAASLAAEARRSLGDDRYCDACGAEAGEECRPMCTGQAAAQDELAALGYMSARGGKWHRATVAEPMFTRDEVSGCGLTFRPLNVTWNGERPPTNAAHMCQRPGCSGT